MTTPPTPGDLYAPTPGLAPKAAKDSFWAKVAQAEQQNYVSGSRPGLSNALATGTATPDQLQQIATFVRALDVAKTQKMNQLAGINVTPGTEAADLLNSVGESPQVIARLHGDNSTAQDSQDPSAAAAWFSEVGKNVADNLANSGDLIFPQSSNANPDQNPDGSSPNWFVNGLWHTLSAVGNVPGWLYRTEKNLFETKGMPLLNDVIGKSDQTAAMQRYLGLPQQQETEKALGYDPNNLLSNMAFAWSQGHAAFNNLDGVVQTYGQDKVNAALNVFDRQSLYKDENDALTQYVQDLQGQAQAGKITPDQFAEQVNFLNSKEFADVYHAVDMQHQSIGRDFARALLPGSMQHADDSGMFTFVSGGLDAGFDLLADPTIVGGKVVKAFQLGKYALEAYNATKAARILGVTDKVTGAVNKATALGGRVQGFLDQATKVRDLAEQGDTVAAAAEHARMVRQFNDLTPFIETVNGKRLAITAEQRAEAEAAGTTIRIGRTDALAVKSDPITTLEQFHEMLVNEGGLARFAKGVGATDLRIMPGKVGIIQRSLAKIGADKGTIAGAVAARGVANKGGVILDYLKDADKTIPSDWSELLQKIANSKGTEQFEALQGQLGVARKMRATAELATRRMTSLLPGVKTIAFNSDSSGAEIERFARLSLPKYQASILRYLWDHEATSDATRRAIGRGIVNTVAEAGGLTRSVPGRELLDNWNLGMDELDKARYAWGDTDKMATIDGGERRAAMNISQLETHLELPSFDDMRIIAAKAAILGYDSRLADGELGEGFANWFTDAAGNKDVAGGLANMAMHPWRTAKFALLNSAPAMRTMSVLKMGWLLTSANMLRQYLEEYTGIAADGSRRTVLRAGKRYMALNNDANRFIIRVHNLIPSFRRHMVVTTDDAGREIIKSKYRMVFGGGVKTPLTDAEETAVAEAAQKYASPDVLAALGARHAGQLDGIDVAVQSHRDGVLHVRSSWNGKGAPPPRIVVSHSPSHFKGYTEDELNGDAGRAALSDMYGRMFHDEDEPALRALAYLAWNHAADNPAFLAALPKATLDKMQELYPVDEQSFKVATGEFKGLTPEEIQAFKDSGEEFLHGTSAKFDQFSGDRAHTNTGRSAGDKIYMTDQPKVANTFAWAGSGKAAQELPDNFFRRVAKGRYEGVTPELQEQLRALQDELKAAPLDGESAVYSRLYPLQAKAMRQVVEHELARGWRVRVDAFDGADRRVISDPAELDGLDPEVFTEPSAWAFIPPDRDPRVIKAKVYGKTLDLRQRQYVENKQFGGLDIKRGRGGRAVPTGNKVPESLAEKLRAEKMWSPEQDATSGNVYAHEHSTALTQWMREHGYGKALVDDSGESGMWSVIALPEMIEHGGADPVADFLARNTAKLNPPSTQPLKDYVANDPRTARFRQLAERLNTDRYGNPIKPGDDVARAEAVEDYVHNQIANVAAGVYRSDGKTMHAPLVSQLLSSKVPSAEELQKFSLTNLPAHVIRAEFEPAPLGNVGKFGQGITQVFSSAFDKIVTNPMYRLIRKPLFTGMYVNRRVALMPWEKQLVEEFGWKPEEAKTLMSSLAEQQALQDTIRYIDNPAARSQFSVIAQNVWLFYRAQEDWGRRWGRILKEDPTLIRKAHMAIMAGVHGGMLDRDADGNLIFTYPGSGAVTEGLMHVANLIEGHPGALVPHVDDLTSRVTWLNPALMNPVGFSASPAVSIPVDFMSKFIPGADLFRAQADLAMNGQQGAGRAYWEQFFPSALRRLIQLTPMDGSPDNTGSTIGSAAASAITNAAILGKTPDGGDDLEKQKFISNTQTQTLNALLARAAFGFFAPGTPSMPELYGQEPADFSYRAMGVRSLDDEFKVMSASMGFENALVVWHDLHPDKMILATAGKTDSSAKGASVDYTFGASQWVLAHKDLFDGPYGRVAAYFIPPAPGQFDQAGFNTMTEIGVRQYKDLSQYYTDIVSKNAVTTWFDSKDDYDAAMAAVTVNGNLDELVKTWQKDGLTATRILQLQNIYKNAQAAGLTKQAVNDAYTQRKTDLYAQYPILHSYFAETQARKDQTRQALNQLTAMVNDPSVNLPDMDGAAKMLVVKDNYEKAYAPLKSQRSTDAEAQKAQLLDSYDQAMQQIVAAHPNLKDLYNGVFRYLESSG